MRDISLSEDLCWPLLNCLNSLNKDSYTRADTTEQPASPSALRGISINTIVPLGLALFWLLRLHRTSAVSNRLGEQEQENLNPSYFQKIHILLEL